MDYLDLIKKQEEIDKVYVELKKLNHQHNEFLSNREKTNNSDSIDSINGDILKLIPQIFLIQVIAVILFALASFVPFVAFILSIPMLVWLNKVSKKIRKFRQEGSLNLKPSQELEEDNQVYEKLCEKRALYHQLVKELRGILDRLSTPEYQEYLRLLKEYQEVVGKYAIREEKDLEENIDSLSSNTESAINLGLNKSKVQ